MMGYLPIETYLEVPQATIYSNDAGRGLNKKTAKLIKTSLLFYINCICNARLHSK